MTKAPPPKDQPKDPISQRYICTAEHPYSNDKDGLWMHPESDDKGEAYFDDEGFDYYQCRVCGLRYSVQVAR